jgi:hypothetical protein
MLDPFCAPSPPPDLGPLCSPITTLGQEPGPEDLGLLPVDVDALTADVNRLAGELSAEAHRRRVALEAAARHGAAWRPEEVLRRAKEFEDWLAGGPTPPQPRPRDEHPGPNLW